ncbi:30S ribosomal protein S1 [Geodia barretti]|uniref:30S ribosomal protein S1 n=1 Tax=Geodia barretti TaxID=519541 RepID=A0AA35WMF3_GEOBA|nr:30S ribosomal protein S1 [Geodia barretti]
MVEGDIVTGTVLHMTESDVIVDVGYKSEGIIALDEFRDVDGNVRVREGDEIDVLVQRADNRRGHLVLSHRKAEKMKVWNQIEDAFEKQTPVRGRVVDRIRGGLEVDIGEIGVRGFLPGSQVDLRPVRNLGSYKGRELELRVIKLNKRRGNIVLSRRVVLEEEKTKTLAALEVGRVFRGEVRDLTEYGAFVDIGGICGLLHIREMSFRRLEHPSELMKVGDQIEVVILRFDAEAERVSLGYKQLNVDPWTTAHDRYAVGTRVRGKVVSITDYGAFIEMEPGVEGLIHVSEIWNKRVNHPSEVLNVGDDVETVVLSIDPENRRLSLGLKQLSDDAWEGFFTRHQEGDLVDGTVIRFADFGAFVQIEEGIEGLLRLNDIDEPPPSKAEDRLHLGQPLKLRIVRLSRDDRKVGLSLRAAEEGYSGHGESSEVSSVKIGDVWKR